MAAPSRYAEQVVIPGLTLYDIHRAPRKLVRRAMGFTQPAPPAAVLSGARSPCRQIEDPDVLCKIPFRTLNAELQCPVCMSICKNATIVMEVRQLREGRRPPAPALTRLLPRAVPAPLLQGVH